MEDNIDMYNFEDQPDTAAIHNGHVQEGQSILADPESLNQTPEYSRLHLGEVSLGQQIIAVYETKTDAGTATGTLTLAPERYGERATEGWHVIDAPEGRELSRYSDATLHPSDEHGMMNRGLFLHRGDRIGITQTAEDRIKTVGGSIISISLARRPKAEHANEHGNQPQHPLAKAA